MLNLRLPMSILLLTFSKKSSHSIAGQHGKVNFSFQRKMNKKKITSDNGIKLKEDKIPLRYYHQQTIVKEKERKRICHKGYLRARKLLCGLDAKTYKYM